MKLVITEYGSFLGRTHNRFIVKNHQNKDEILSNKIDQIYFLNTGTSVSISAIDLALKNNSLIIFGRLNGWPYGFVTSPKFSGLVQGKREQFLAYHDKRGVRLAKKFASGKMKNQKNLLKLLGKNRTKTEMSLSERMNESAEKIEKGIENLMLIPEDKTVDSIRTDIMNREAIAAKIYWSTVLDLFPQELMFKGRKTRGATDPVNMMLNFGYKAILFVETWKSIYYAGLDPYAGFLHADKHGRPSLALDLMEEFRPQVVDRIIFSIITKRVLNKDNVSEYDNDKKQHRLTQLAIKTIFEKISDQLESRIPYNNQHFKIKDIISIQARNITSFLRNRSKDYIPFEILW